MEITGGSMNYEIGFDYSKLLKGANQILAAFGKMDDAVKAFGSLGDDWTRVTKEQVDAQKKAIQSLEKEYSELLKLSNTRKLSQKESNRKSELNKEIEAEKSNLEDMEAALKALALAEKDPRRQLTELQRTIRSMSQAGMEDTETYKKLYDIMTKLGKEDRNFRKNMRMQIDPMRTLQVASSLKQVAKSIEEIGKASGNANLEKTGQLVNAIADGVQGFVHGGWIGVLIAGIGETISRITELISATEKLDKALETAKLKAFTNEINELLKAKPMDNIFGKDSMATFDNATKALNKAEEAIRDIKVSTDGMKESWLKYISPIGMMVSGIRDADSEMETFNKSLEKGMSEIEAFPLTMKKSSWFGETFGFSDEFKSLGNVMKDAGIAMEEKFGIPSVKALQTVKESFKDLSEEQKMFIDKLIATRQALDDSLKATADYMENLFGQVSSQLADNIVETFAAGGRAAVNYDKILANISKTMAKQVVQHILLEEVLNKYKPFFLGILRSTNDWATKVEYIQKMFNLMKPEIEGVAKASEGLLKDLNKNNALNTNSDLASRLQEEAQAIAEAQNKRIELMKDGYDKEIAQIKESRKQEREALQREIASSNGMKSGGTIKALQDQIKLSKQLEEKELKELEEKWQADIIKANEEFADLQLKEAQKRVDREFEVQQAIVDAMDEGLSKELAQMEINHEKKIETIRRNAEAEAKEVAEANAKVWMNEQLANGNKVELADYYQSDVFKSMVNGLTPEQQAELDKKMQERIKEQQQKSAKQIDDAYDKSLQKYGSYTAKREAIDKKYNADIIALEKRRQKMQQDGLQGSKEYQQTEEAIAQAEIDRADAVTDLNLQYTELSQLIAERERLEKRLQLVREGGEDVDGLSEEQLQKALKETKKKIKSLSQQTFSEYLDEHKSELISQGLDMITDSLYGLAEATGSLNAKQAADFFSSIKMGVQGVMSGGVWGLLIAGIEDTISQITNAFIGAEALASQVEHGKVAAWQQEMANLREQGKEGIFGEDQITNVRNAVLALDESRVKLHELSNEWQKFDYDFNHFLEGTNPLSWHNWAEIFTDAEENVKTYFEALEKGYSKLEAHVLRKQDRGWLLNFFGIDDRYGSLKDMAKDIGFDELYDKYGNLDSNVLRTILETYTDLSEADKRWIEEAIAYSDEYAAALEQIADYLEGLFGNVADTIADQMLEAFIKSGDAAIDFGAVVGDVGKQMTKDLLKSMIMERYFTGMKDDFIKKIEEEGGMTADAAGYIIQQVQNAATKLDGELQYWNQVLTGWSTIWGDVEAASIGAGTALSSTSQESIDLMNGQLNAMRAYQGRMETMMSTVVLQLSGIHNDMNSHFEESNRRLASIDSNTSKEGLVRSLGAYFD